MQSQKVEQVQKIILLPTKSVHQQLAPLVADLKDFSIRFINGYRNILQSSTENQISWTLIQNQGFCGQAFCYLLKSGVKIEDLLKKQLPESIVIKEVNDQMLIVQSKTSSQLPEVKLTKQKIQQLIEQVAENKKSRKLALNLLKNAFSQYETFKKCVGQSIQQIEKEIKEEQQQKLPSAAEMIVMENDAKKLHGNSINQLPKCNQQTGDWSQNELIEIKLTTE